MTPRTAAATAICPPGVTELLPGPSTALGHPLLLHFVCAILCFMVTKPNQPDLSTYQLPAVIARNERIVRTRFWTKLLKEAGKIPFAEEMAAAYFCVIDPKTPASVKALLLAALAYFVLPFEFLPAFFLALGLTGEAAVAVGIIRMMSGHIKPQHYQRARAALGISEPVA